jgi:hypothetical protein
MVGVFVDQHLRQQTGSWTATFDGTRRQCRLADLLSAGGAVFAEPKNCLVA